MRWLGVSIPIFLALLGPAGPDDRKPATAGSCVVCIGVGTRPCPAHGSETLALEAKVENCTRMAKCGTCFGTLRVDCDKCPTGDKDWAKAVEAKKRWVESLKPHFDVLGRPLAVVHSKHVRLTWEGGDAIVGKRKIGEHESIHLYVDRCEEVYRVFCETFGATEQSFTTKFDVMVWEARKDHVKVSEHYLAQPNPNTGVKRMGAVGIYTVYLDPNEVDPDENAGADLHRNIVHNVAHLLLANAWVPIWPGEMQGGWIDEGVAHWFEDRLDRRCTNFCYREQDTTQNFRGGRWRDPVKKMAASRERASFADVAIKRTDELTLEDHALSWSWCDFLISRNPKGFARIVQDVKAGKGYREALRSEYGWNALEFEEEWQKYVRTYVK